MPTVKLRAGGYWNNVDLDEVGDRWTLGFRYSPALIAEVKAMENARWNPVAKTWSVLRSPRNKFVLSYLMGKPVYERYDRPLETIVPNRTSWCGHAAHRGKCPVCGCPWCLQQHQMVMINHVMTRRRSILAGKPGTGKTLVAIEALEALGGDDLPIYAGPESAIQGATAEFRKWKSRVIPQFVTYDGLKRLLANWKEGSPPPRRVILDESSRLKNHKTQRSEACLFLSHQMEAYWKGEEFLLLMTGTPAPNDPTDWWMQCEIARPGYLREASYYAIAKRLEISEERQGLSGYYPAHIQWRDGKECVKCAERAKQEETEREEARKLQQALAEAHQAARDAGIEMSDAHNARVQALATQDLESILIASHNSSSCEHCGGTGRVPNEVEILSKRLDGLALRVEKPNLPDKQYRVIEIKPAADVLRAAELIATTAANALEALNRLRQLSDGFLYDRETHQPDYCKGSAKEKVVVDLLDEYSEQGRLIIYAAYTASIDRLSQLCKEQGWLVWRYDGKHMETWDGSDFQTAYTAFQDPSFKSKIVYIANAQKGGMSLTLTASVAAVFYSNDFQGESREQAEDRIHRIGMDENKGATIIDIIYLGSDKLVRDRLLEKRGMQDLSMASIRDAIAYN